MNQSLSAALSARQAPTRRRKRKFDFFPYAMLAPIAILLCFVIVYPLFEAVRLSLSDASLLNLARAKFIGLKNFERLLNDSIFMDGIWRTIRWVLAVVLIEISLALPIALFLNRDFAGRGFVRAAVMVPYITPPAVVALLFLYIFDGNFGIANEWLVNLGFQENYTAWMSDPASSFWIVVSAMVWYGMPLMALILLAALQTIPQELYEAADVDGASAWTQFWRITVPHILPSIMFLGLLRTIWMSNHIDMIFIMTAGGPGFANYTEAVYSFKLTDEFRIGYASAVAVALSVVLMAGAALYVRYLARSVLKQAS